MASPYQLAALSEQVYDNHAPVNTSVRLDDLSDWCKRSEARGTNDFYAARYEKMKCLNILLESRKCFTTAQVCRRLALFPFDKNKLPFAGTSYKYMIDEEHFYELEESFDFISTKRELRQMIR